MPIKKVDANQPTIVRDLREAGATVEHLHTLGKGCPDILVGFRGRTWLFEIKTFGGALTADEIDWHAAWRGQVDVIYSAQDALKIMGVIE